MKRNEEKTLEIAFRNFCVTDGHSDGHSDRPRDRPSYRDARTHLKTLLNLELTGKSLYLAGLPSSQRGNDVGDCLSLFADLAPSDCQVRQDRARQDKTGQDGARQDKTGQDRIRQGKAGQDKTLNHAARCMRPRISADK